MHTIEFVGFRVLICIMGMIKSESDSDYGSCYGLKHTSWVWGFIMILNTIPSHFLWLLGCASSDALDSPLLVWKVLTRCRSTHQGFASSRMSWQPMFLNSMFPQPVGTAGLWKGVRFYAKWKGMLEEQWGRRALGPGLWGVGGSWTHGGVLLASTHLLLSQLEPLDESVCFWSLELSGF